jgi:hypothetical protein
VALCSRCRWLVRAPLVLVATSELVKLRFVVVQQAQAELPNAFGYFFWLYCAYVAVQVSWVVQCQRYRCSASNRAVQCMSWVYCTYVAVQVSWVVQWVVLPGP